MGVRKDGLTQYIQQLEAESRYTGNYEQNCLLAAKATTQ